MTLLHGVKRIPPRDVVDGAINFTLFVQFNGLPLLLLLIFPPVGATTNPPKGSDDEATDFPAQWVIPNAPERSGGR